MKNFKNKFDSLLAEYRRKQPVFKKKIARWRKAKRKKGEALLNDIDNLSKDIQDVLSKQEDKIDKTSLETKIKSFKKQYQDVCELTQSSLRQWGKALVVALIIVVLFRTFIFGLYKVSTGSGEVNLLVGDRVCGNKLSYSLNANPKRGDLVIFRDPIFDYDNKSKFNKFWQKSVGVSVPILGLSAGPDILVKRVIAVPGDTIEGKVEDGRVTIYLNGKRLYEPYVNPYPLIALEKKTGFIPLNRFFFLKMPDLLRSKTKVVHYTYDPEVDFSDQPFYEMYSDEVVLKPRMLIPWFKMSGMPTRDKDGKIVDEFGPYVVPEGKYWVMGDSRRNSVDSRFWGVLDENLIRGKANFILYSIDSEESLWLFDFIKRPVKFWEKDIRWDRFFKSLKQQPGLVT